ncbi:DUF485 domain-containing protein [Burkholderia sp. Bp9126]|nr:DUF485 domain-containing protein [Burkholderia sp. Bp9126]
MSNVKLSMSISAEANASAGMLAPDVSRLVRRRTRLSLGMSLLVLGVYFTFILTVAFAPGVLTLPFSADSRMTVGIVIGIGLYWFCAITTGAYVWAAGRWIDPLVHRITR